MSTAADQPAAGQSTAADQPAGQPMTTDRPTPPDQPTAADRPGQPHVAPLDPPMLPFAIGGTAVWVILGLVLLIWRGWLRDHGHTDWLWACLAGALLGLLGTYLMIVRDRRRRQRHEDRHDRQRR